MAATDGEITRLNALVREYFSRVVLRLVPDGVSIVSILSESATDRTFGYMKVNVQGFHVAPDKDRPGQVTITPDMDHIVGLAFSPEGSPELVKPHRIIATGAERVTPPLLELTGITAPAGIDFSPRSRPAADTGAVLVSTPPTSPWRDSARASGPGCDASR